jgi:two-component system nitrate/nitrite response regulator NarL
VDDHPSLLNGIALVLRETEDLELVATATTAEAGLEAAAEQRPDVAIMDVRVPHMGGVAAIEQLQELAPDTAAVMYSAYGDRRVLTDALGAGARGYVLKGSPIPDLLRAIRTVAGGGAYVDPSLSPTLLMDPSSADAPLPEREREILHLLAEGLRTDEVAERIGLSSETVKSDTKRAVNRLEATGRVHAVANALRRSYIT